MHPYPSHYTYLLKCSKIVRDRDQRISTPNSKEYLFCLNDNGIEMTELKQYRTLEKRNHEPRETKWREHKYEP